MAVVTVRYYVDVLSSWCYIADLALARIEEKYGDGIAVDWRIAQLFGGGPLPYDQAKLKWYYARTARMSGVQLNEAWLDSPEATTAYGNLAIEALRSLGVTDSRARRAFAHAALVGGEPLGGRDAAIAAAARISGHSAAVIDSRMRDPAVAERIAETTDEFEQLNLPQRPSFVLRNTSGDVAIFSGLYTFESLDAAIGEMLRASQITEELGPEPA